MKRKPTIDDEVEYVGLGPNIVTKNVVSISFYPHRVYGVRVDTSGGEDLYYFRDGELKIKEK